MDETRGSLNATYRPAQRESMTPYQSLKVLGFFVILLGPGIPLTIFLWRLAVGG